jgi:hypothetical protein
MFLSSRIGERQLFRADSLHRPRHPVTAAMLGSLKNSILFSFVLFLLPSSPASLILFFASYCILHLFPLLIPLLPPRRYPYFDVVVGLVWSHDPKGYACGSVCYW